MSTFELAGLRRRDSPSAGLRLSAQDKASHSHIAAPIASRDTDWMPVSDAVLTAKLTDMACCFMRKFLRCKIAYSDAPKIAIFIRIYHRNFDKILTSFMIKRNLERGLGINMGFMKLLVKIYWEKMA